MKIGVIAPLTGEDSELGKGALPGIRLAARVQPYLANGDKVELSIKDDGSIPEKAAEIAWQLSHEEKVSALLLVSKSDVALHIVTRADEIGVPILALSSSHPGVTQNPWMSQLIFDDEIQGIVAALYVIDELLVEKTTVFRDPSDPHSVFLANEFAATYKEAGGITKVIDIPEDEGQLSELVKGIDPLFCQFFYAPISAEKVLWLEKVLRQSEIEPGIMLSDGVMSGVLHGFGEDVRYLDGMLATDVYSFRPEKTPFGRTMSEVFEREFQGVGTTYTALGAEGTALLMAAIERCGDSTDRLCIKNSMRSGEKFFGFTGAIRILQSGKVERPVYVNRIEDGKLKNIVKIY